MCVRKKRVHALTHLTTRQRPFRIILKIKVWFDVSWVKEGVREGEQPWGSQWARGRVSRGGAFYCGEDVHPTGTAGPAPRCASAYFSTWKKRGIVPPK